MGNDNELISEKMMDGFYSLKYKN